MESLRKKLESLNLEDYILLRLDNHERMIRFSDNSVTVVKDVRNSAVFVYMAKGGRRMAGITYDIKALETFLESMYRSLMASPPSEYAHLPKGPFKYTHNGDVDLKVVEEDLSSLAGRAIDSALNSGAKRVAGSLTAEVVELKLWSSAGAEGVDRRSNILLNVRAFTERDASGHGLSVATKPGRFDPEYAGRIAGEYSKMAKNPKTIEEGEYEVLMSPTVSASLFELVGSASSAFDVDAGLSFLADKLGKRVGAEVLTLIDHGQILNGVGSRSFDDEGLPTRDNTIIEKGILRTYLHNSTTAKKFGTESTANAGIIEPSPWNLEVLPGDMTEDEMLKEMKRGLFITNNWYTRFQSYRSGEFSTIPRDAIFYVEKGEIKHPVTGIRLSGSLPKFLSSIKGMGKERRWIKWWEVETPVLTPAVLVEGMKVTRAI
jgi:PmbA protein